MVLKIELSRVESGNQVIYHIKDGPEIAFVKEELMLIPEDTELSPDYSQKCPVG